MERILKRTWAQVELDSLVHNANAIRKQLHKGCKLMAIVKADAYGHGAPQSARTLERYVDMFGVSNLDEAKQLRAAGISVPILILGYTPAEFTAEIIKYSLIQTVTEKYYAKQLENFAETLDERVAVHVKLDTGMTRLGFPCQTKEQREQSVSDIEDIFRSGRLKAEGVYTHFAVSDDTSSDFTKEQFARFTEAVAMLEEKGVRFAVKHCCNSAAIVNFPEMQLDMVRAGLLLYGIYPDKAMADIGVKPVMSLLTSVSQVKQPQKGATLSYGRTYEAEAEMKTATLSIGYADGFSRVLSDKAQVLIGGKRAKIVGRICMDQCIARCDGIDVKVGQTATVFGRDGDVEITADELAEQMGTISYEIVCLVGKRVPRVYIRNGREVDFLNYIL